jgi:hypothetical protein
MRWRGVWLVVFHPEVKVYESGAPRRSSTWRLLEPELSGTRELGKGRMAALTERAVSEIAVPNTTIHRMRRCAFIEIRPVKNRKSKLFYKESSENDDGEGLP